MQQNLSKYYIIAFYPNSRMDMWIHNDGIHYVNLETAKRNLKSRETLFPNFKYKLLEIEMQVIGVIND